MKKLVPFIIILLLILPQAFAQEQKVKISEVIETYRGQKVYIHFVEQGETLSALARAYGVSVDQIKATNPEAPEILKPYQIVMIPFGQISPDQKPKEITPEIKEIPPSIPAAQKKPDGNTHIIEPKETWYALSRRYEIPIKQLLEANPGVDTLRIGQSIIIPELSGGTPSPVKAETPGTVTQIADKPGYILYTVRPKETLYGIAREYKTTVDELIRLNPVLKEGLKEGQQIQVPSTITAQQPTATTEQQPVAVTPQKPLASNQQKPANYIEHRVERKETLYSISKKYDVSTSEIIRLNPGIGGVLRRGDVLRIPLKQLKPVETDVKAAPDTVVLGRDIYQEATKPVASSCTPGADTRIFKVALLLPFSLETLDEITTSGTTELPQPEEYRSFDFIQFYQGALIGLDAAAEMGIKLKIEVLDSDAGNNMSKTRQIISSGKLDGSHLIIGPLFAESFELVADYASKHNIPIVNPLSQRAEILSNPQVIKIQSSPWTIYNGAARQLVETYPDANFTVVRRNATENSTIADTFESALQKAAGPGHFKTVNYAQTHEQGMLNAMIAGRKNVVILLTNDKAFIPAVLRRLYENQKKYDITIMGMPEWENMEIDIHYLKSLHAHFFASRYVDYSNPETIKFIQEFRKRYIAEPETVKFAFMGYDVARYFTQALYYYGPGFINCLPDYSYNGLSDQFRFYRSERGGYDNTGMFVYRYNEFKRENIKQP
ncbi:MAG: LysM peptidoglycan-binding domain-containing protein [Lentimicrobium sp.]|nr:LysM peptidoglycan-binding domain-containing protein [Lentimicrobium sp.]